MSDNKRKKAAVKLQAQARKLHGRKVKKLRQEGWLPANIYGNKIKSQSIKVDEKDFKKIYFQTGLTNVLELSLQDGGKSIPVLIHNLQFDPITDKMIHVDFYQVDLTKKITANVAIKITGVAPAVASGGVLLKLVDEVEVEALPADLPDKLVLDISSLDKIGASLTAQDLQFDKSKVALKLDDPKTLIVKIEEPSKEEEKPLEKEEEAGEEEATKTETEADGKTDKSQENKNESDKESESSPA